MIIKIHKPLFILIFFLSSSVFGQDISLYKNFNGRYDFIFIGNTMNTIENNSIVGQPAPPCIILTSSSADLNLNPSDIIESAYLYWAGSGTGDFDVKLNNQDIIPDRTFSIINSAGDPCFSAFKDITLQVETTGNGNYTLSELDLSSIISDYCPYGGNFAGWAIIVVYKNNSLPLNQLNIYDGLQAVPSIIDITLDSLNVIDNLGAKIGFVAWEGDKNIANNETLSINGNSISSPLNPVDNAFNGTNSFTGATNMYNMDLDVYDIQNNINIGDTSAQIQLTSSQDFVMINAIVTKLNSQLPDATITIDNIGNFVCNSRDILVDYTVWNLNSTDPLPAGTPIAIYINGTYLQSTVTSNILQIDESESGQIALTIPAGINSPFDLRFVVDDNGTGVGIVTEANENNNTDISSVSLWLSPSYNTLPNILVCNESPGSATFDFSAYEQLVKVNPADIVAFYVTLEDAETETNPIPSSDWANFIVNTSPKEIFVRIKNDNDCTSITSFFLIIGIFPSYNTLPDILVCRDSSGNGTFNFSNYEQLVKVNPFDLVDFYTTLEDAEIGTNPIPSSDWTNFTTNTSPKEIFVRIKNNDGCASITSFFLIIRTSPSYNTLPDISVCSESSENGIFNFSDYEQSVKVNPADLVDFYVTREDAEIGTNPIPRSDWTNFTTNTSSKEIFVQIKDDNGCVSITSFFLIIRLYPSYNTLPDVLACNEGLGRGTFNFSNYEEMIKVDPADNADFYATYEDAEIGAENGAIPILNMTNFIANTTPKEIFVRIENEYGCISITSFLLKTENCPPIVHDFVSANGDPYNYNNVFFVEGLRDVFVNFKTSIYNRWGVLVWTGNNSTPDWDGFANKGTLIDNNAIPAGTYYYVIELNDPEYPEPLVGYLYLTR